MKKIPRYRFTIEPELAASAAERLTSGNLVTGGAVASFEERTAQLLGRQYAVATCNGFAALNLALLAHDIRNKRVLLPALSTCFAAVHAATAAQNEIVFCDINANTGNLDVEEVKKHVATGAVDAAISISHFGIRDEWVESIGDSIPIIEDAAQSFYTHSLSPSKAKTSVYSIYPSKGIVGIDGGIVATDNREIANAVRKCRYYDNQFEFEDAQRFNYRPIDLNFHIAAHSLDHIEGSRRRIREIETAYRNVIGTFQNPHLLSGNPPYISSRFVVVFSTEEQNFEFRRRMGQKGIECAAELLNLTPNSELSEFPNARRLLSRHSSIPLYAELTSNEQQRIVEALGENLPKLAYD